MSAPATFGLVGRLIAHPGQRAALVAHLCEAAELMQNAPGCELYAVGTPDTGNDVWVTEIWTSREHHDASLSLPGVQALIGRARPLIADMEQLAQLHLSVATGHRRVTGPKARDDR